MAARNETDSFYLAASLLKHGGNPNLVEPEDHATPLHQAVSSRRLTNLDLLIQAVLASTSAAALLKAPL